MTDEPTLRTKTYVLDLVISFMMEHEKQMDQMLERIERIVPLLLRKSPEYPQKFLDISNHSGRILDKLMLILLERSRIGYSYLLLLSLNR